MRILFITDFKEKAELFNYFFSKQCSLLANHSKLPASLSFRTDKRLSSVTFSAEDIGKIIQGNCSSTTPFSMS